MSLRFVKEYKTALILSITLAIILVATTVERQALNIGMIFLGSILGTFLLDLDYILHAFFIAPETQESGLIREYLKHYDLAGLGRFISEHKNEIKDKTLNSALFQVVLGAAVIFTISSNAGLVLKTLILSAFLNSIYRLIEEYLHDNIKSWFWTLKVKTTPTNIYGYFLALLAILFYSIIQF